MKTAAVLILSALVLGAFDASPATAQQRCPTGSHPWVDAWGNRICKRHSDGRAATIEAPSAQACPRGTHPWVDNWGNKVCRTQETGRGPPTDYYDASKGCPTGSHPWVDEWGNRICKRF